MTPKVASHLFSSRQHHSSTTVLYAASASNKDKEKDTNKDTSKENDAVLSDLDARVLQNMLQQDKLDLNEEENMRRLLERGVKSKEPLRTDTMVDDEKETKYSSQVLQTLGNTKLWKAFQRNAEDWLESAQIFVSNKVERDSKLLASLGIFAFERAMEDVKRALPAASAAAQRVAPKVLRLSATSSASNVTSDNATTTTKDSIRQGMSTPSDEFQSVSQDIKDIFQSGGDRNARSTNRRGLRTVTTSKTGKDRFKKAFVRRQETTLRKERENLAQSSTRLASNVMDSAYQLKRELEVEPNQPGYKTKALREGAVSVTKLLASGTKALLGGAKAVAQTAALAPESTTLPPKATTNFMVEGAMDATVTVDSTSTTDSTTTPAVAVGTSTSTVEGAVVSPSIDTSSSDKPTNTRGPWAFPWTPTRATSTSIKEDVVVPPPIQASNIPVNTQRRELEALLKIELASLAQRLGQCIEHPEETWLRSELLTQNELDSWDGNALEPIVTLMVTTQQTMEQVDETAASFGDLLQALQVAKNQVDQIIMQDTQTVAGSTAISEYLERQLIYGQDFKEEENEGIPVLLRLQLLEREWKLLDDEEELEQLKQQIVTESVVEETVVAEPAVQEAWTRLDVERPVVAIPVNGPEPSFATQAMPQQQETTAEEPVLQTNVGIEEDDDDDGVIFATKKMDVDEDAPIKEVEVFAHPVEVVDVIPEISYAETSSTTTVEVSRDDSTAYRSKFDVDHEPDTMRLVTSEIVTDDDFDNAVGETKAVETAPETDLGQDESEPNVVVKGALRLFDIFFLVIEKTVMVRCGMVFDESKPILACLTYCNFSIGCSKSIIPWRDSYFPYYRCQ
jgi:hypothetical protein